MLEVKNMVKTFFKGTINEKTALPVSYTHLW